MQPKCSSIENWIKKSGKDLPGGPVVKNLPSNAGDAGSIPGQGTKVPHVAGQLSLRTATTEPSHFGAHAPQLERSLHTTTKTRCSQIKRKKKKEKEKKRKKMWDTHIHTYK